ncbi:hypothetical protein [uncultured Pluralibacter sp.]|uniref:hypothetical protein n=1 Tax=uncultured Pluralibacter sp. TaxID=1490864 RepID=UPI0026116907|nr:hypothetical protein [uncultured Pluralibacter sp.]
MNAEQIARGIIDGLSSIPEGLYLSIMRTWDGSGVIDRRNKIRNEMENERFFHVLKSMTRSESPLRQLVTIVITDFYARLDQQGKQAIAGKQDYANAKLGSRLGAQTFIVQRITEIIVQRVRMKRRVQQLVRLGTAFTLNILMIQGLIEESARASRRMRLQYPQTYYKVSTMNLDMIYFLAEDELEPYLIYFNSHPMQCKGIENEICNHLSG